MHQLGIMQGRLSPKPEGRIQAFPVDNWRQEMGLAQEIGFALIEWVLDYDSAEANPLLSVEGRREINRVRSQHGIELASVCCDYFMEAPFAVPSLAGRLQARGMLDELICVCPEVGIRYIELPLIGESGLEDQAKRRLVLGLLEELTPLARAHGIQIILECSLPPHELGEVAASLPSDTIGINYDLGNSAYWSFDSREEFAAYGDRIANIHIKDCTPADYSVPLGKGAVDFELCFSLMQQVDYQGDFIMQAAMEADYLGAARRQFEFTRDLVQRYFS